jgi:hypothetical protein
MHPESPQCGRHEDLEHHAVKSRGSSKGKKCSAQPLQDSEVPPMKKRRKIIEESEDEDYDEPLGVKGKASAPPDQSMEGGYFSLPDATGN